MNKILILGAGRSTYFLIKYLTKKANENEWSITVVDLTEANFEGLQSNARVHFLVKDIKSDKIRKELIESHHVVISMVPPPIHPIIANDCLQYRSHLLTASYMSEEIRNMHDKVQERDLLFLKEIGLDPGIDHMSAKQLIDRIHDQGGKIHSFKSYTGGLIAPSSDDNPWHYKISWNPMNIVKAGQGTAKYLSNNQIKLVPYQQLFNRTGDVEIPNYGGFETYFNRNSLNYQSFYELDDVSEMVRGTVRKKGFCSAWHQMVQLGLTDDEYSMNWAGYTYQDFLNTFLDNRNLPLATKTAELLNIDPEGEDMARLKWLGLFSNEPLPIQEGSPAEVLRQILTDKMSMKSDDRDLIVMVHFIDYEVNGTSKRLKSWLTLEGEDGIKTAMAKTVGLPLAIAATKIMEGQIDLAGTHIPVQQSIYNPVIEALSDEGVVFKEEEIDLN